jgi:hypothetical protein
MKSRHTSFDLLAHFDRPKTADESAIARVVGVERSEPPASSNEALVELPPIKKRGIRWVLKWAVALGVLAIAAAVLTEFAYLLGAEHKLSMAARAGVLEATLPRATYKSVTAAVERRLTSYPLIARQLQISLLQNGSPAPRLIQQSDGDRFTITLDAPNAAAVPGWLQRILPWRGDSRIQAQAERRMPSRKLAASNANHTAAE